MYNDKPVKRQYQFSVPVLIYQMGMVGCTTIKNTLDAARNDILVAHPVHYLNWQRIVEVENYYRQAKNIDPPQHVSHSRNVRVLIDNTWGLANWTVISMIRDPVSREIANSFDKYSRLVCPVSSNDCVRLERLVSAVLEDLAENVGDLYYTLSWFDCELKEVFEFDVYQHPFRKDRGYEIYRTDQTTIAIAKLEHLDFCFKRLFKDILNIELDTLVNGNRSDKKVYWKAYQAFRRKFRISDYLADAIYASKFMKHFYSEEERNRFRTMWTSSI